jgi:hypothetical protein
MTQSEETGLPAQGVPSPEAAPLQKIAQPPVPAAQGPVVTTKTADRPHRITIALGLLSPSLALLSLGVSFYVFRGSQQSIQVAQRAYLGFHLESAQVLPNVALSDGAKDFRVHAIVSVKNIGNTPAYIDTVKKELYAIEADNMWDHIGGARETSPNVDALGPKGEPLLLEHNSGFNVSDFTGERSVVYRVEIQWHDAFGKDQPPTVFCTILRDITPPISEKRSLSPESCIRGSTVSVGDSR